MRRSVIARPFTGGMRTDAPDYSLNPAESAYAQDLIYPNGIAQQRWGWSFDSTQAFSGSAATKIAGASRHNYPLSGLAQSVVSHRKDSTGKIGNLQSYNGAADTILWDNPIGAVTEWLPRCFYNGETIFCAQDGDQPIVRFAGVVSAPITTLTGTWKMVNQRSTIGDQATSLLSIPPDGSGNSILYLGQFAHFTAPSTTSSFSLNPMLCARVTSIGTGTTQHEIAIDSFRNYSLNADSFVSTQAVKISPTGFAWPAVEVYSAGSISRTSAVSGTSSVWTANSADLSATSVVRTSNGTTTSDALLVINPTSGQRHEICSITGYTVSSGNSGTITTAGELTSQTQAAYKILRGLPFKDACVHRGSICGTGFSKFPNRVYIGPPGWNLSIPPGGTDPFDPVAACGYTSATLTGFVDVADFLMTFYDVPSRYDSNPVVAVLPSSGPLLVLKSSMVYGLYGAWPDFDTTIVANGSGCIDLRSAISTSGVAYWAGSDGIYMFRGGQIQNITEGRIGVEWRSLMMGFNPGTSSVCCGVTSTHLIVSVQGLIQARTGGASNGPDALLGPANRVYAYDLKAGTWSSRLSNVNTPSMFNSKVRGEPDAVLGVDTSGGYSRVIDLAPITTGLQVVTRGSGIAFAASSEGQAASPLDANGVAPQMIGWTGSALAQNSGIAGESKMLDITVHANLRTPYTASTSSLAVTTVHTDGLNEYGPISQSLDPLYSLGTDADAAVRYKRIVNNTGRLHQVRVQVNTTTSLLASSEIAEMTLTFRDTRGST